MKRLLPILFFIIIALLLFLPSCKTVETFDITGTWIISRTFDIIDMALIDTEIIFTGNKFNGMVHIPISSSYGIYSVSVTNDIRFTLNNGTETYIGTWTDEFTIGGTFDWQGNSGTWQATR